MSNDRIAELHEQASEHYLNGDYGGALQAWRDVLQLDPANEQARDGVKMAAQFVERPATPEAVPAELEQELDQGLKVFDALGGSGKPPAADPGATMILDRNAVSEMLDRPAKTPDPARQGDGIDFGDLSAVESIAIDETAVVPDAGEEATWDRPERPAPDEALGLEATPAAPSISAAALELKRRVGDLLAEAQARAAAGERDDALGILARLAILDEDNPEAEALRRSIEAAGASEHGAIEQSIIEGVQALESDRLDDAQRHLEAALSRSPGHREALHYMEKLEARRASAAGAPTPPGEHAAEDLLGSGDHPPAPHPDTAAGAAAAAPIPIATDKLGASGRARSAAALPVAKGGRSGGLSLPSPKLLLFGGLAAVAAVCGVIAYPHVFADKPVPHPAPAAPPKAARAAAPKPADAAPAAPAAAAPQVSSRAALESAEKGRSLLASGDYGGAVVAFNQALALDPSQADARAGLAEAGERYKARKAETDAIDSIRMAFRDGEYTSALRLAYRLPPTVDPSFVRGVQVAGWYNLGVVALRAGDCRGAEGHFSEALGIDPEDPAAARLKDFAVRYADIPKDRGFLDQVEALSFRPVPEL